MALLGRISAVLTANTQDFTRQIGTARREILDFSRTVNGIRLNLDNRALNGTLTNLQRFERTLRQIQRLQAQGVGAGLPDVGRLRDQFRVFEDLGRPLTNLKNQVEGFATAVQSQLYPELSRLQDGFQNLYADIDSGATTFDRARDRIENLRRGLVAFGRATAAAGDFSKLSRSLQAGTAGADFFQPSAKQSLTRALDLRNKASQIPASNRSDVFADLAVRSERNADLIERAAARVAAAQLRIANEGANPGTLTAAGTAQQRLDALTRIQEATNMAFDREITSAQIRQVIAPEGERQVDSLKVKFQDLAATLREGGSTRFDGLIESVGRVIERLNQGTASAKAAKGAIEALAAADRQRTFGKEGYAAADKVLRTDSERTRSDIRRDFRMQRAAVTGDSWATRRLRYGEQAALAREEFNRTTVSKVGDIGSRVKELKDSGLSQEFDNIRKLSAGVSSALKNAFDAKSPKGAALALDDYRTKLAALTPAIEKFEAKVKSAETAQKRFQQFLAISGSRSDKLGADLERAASDITVARQFAGNFGAGNIKGRRNVAGEIEKQIKVYQRIAELQQRVFDKDFKNEAAKLKAIEKVTQAVERQRALLKKAVVDNSQGLVKSGQYDAAADRAAKNRGSFGVGGAAVAQLAFQQGLFAIDDFMSATGGLEYKLRAIGNNITQLGLLLGQSGLIPGLSATAGLFIGLAAVMGGQLASAFARFIKDTETTEQQIKTLNAATSAHESGVKKLADAYKSLADEIRGIGQSDLGRQRSQIDEKVRELAADRTASREEAAASTDPGISRIRARRSVLENQLEKEDNITDRVRIQRQIERTRRQERAALASLSSQASGANAAEGIRGAAAGAVVEAQRALDAAENPFARKDDAIIKSARESLESVQAAMKEFAAFPNFDVNNTAQAGKALEAIKKQLETLDALRESPAAATADGITGAIDALAERLLKEAARIEARLSGAFARVDEQLTRSAYKAAQSLADAGKVIGDAFGESISSSSIQAELDRLADALGQVRQMAGNAATPAEAAAYQADINAINAHAEQLKAAAAATKFFTDALSRISDTFNTDNSAFGQRYEDARRADIAFSTPETRMRRSAAYDEMQAAEQRRRQLDNDIANAREQEEQRLRNDPAARARAARINEIDRRLSAPAGETNAEGVNGGTAAERAAMRAEREQLRQQQEAQVNGSAAVQNARNARDQETARLMGLESIDRGRELAQTPAQKAGKELAANLRDLDAAFKADGVNPAKQAEANRRVIQDAMRSTAPAIFSMADEVQNAVMQGPSRAALQATDVSTVQGAAELNRLLRGDDAAKNQNLVELQKQSQSLDQLVQIAKENGAPPGVFDN